MQFRLYYSKISIQKRAHFFNLEAKTLFYSYRKLADLKFKE